MCVASPHVPTQEPEDLPEGVERLGYPPYFYFLTLVALRIFALKKA